MNIVSESAKAATPTMRDAIMASPLVLYLGAWLKNMQIQDFVAYCTAAWLLTQIVLAILNYRRGRK